MQKNSTLQRYVEGILSPFMEALRSMEAWVSAQVSTIIAEAGMHIDVQDATQLTRAIDVIIDSNTVNELSGRSDVALASPVDGNILLYNGTSWVNSPVPNTAIDLRKQIAINNITDSLAAGDTLRFLSTFVDSYVSTTRINLIESSENGWEHDPITSSITLGTATVNIPEAADYGGTVEEYDLTTPGRIEAVASDNFLYLAKEFGADFEVSFTYRYDSMGGDSPFISLIGLFESSNKGSVALTTSTQSFPGWYWNHHVQSVEPVVALNELIDKATGDITSSNLAEVASMSGVVDGDRITYGRSGTSIYVKINGTVHHTFATESAAALSFFVSQANGSNGYITELSWVEPTITINGVDVGLWEGATGSFTYDDSIIGGVVFSRAIRTNFLLNGDFVVRFKVVAHDNTRLGVYDATYDADFNQNSTDGGLWAMAVSYHLEHNDHYVAEDHGYKYGSTSIADHTVASGDILTFERTGSVITVTQNGSIGHTYTQPCSNPMRFVIVANKSTALGVEDLTFETSGTGMPVNVVSDTIPFFTESATSGYLITAAIPAAAITYGADIIGEISLDGGVTWDEVPIEKRGVVSIPVNGSVIEADLVYGELNFSGTSGTDFIYRWRGSNYNSVTLYATGTGVR